MESLPTLPFDLITEILFRLSVKMLVGFRCVCKSWNSLISDHEFSRKHFKLSTTHKHNLHFISNNDRRYVLKSYPLQSVFTDFTTNFTRLGFPFNYPYGNNLPCIVGSCDGILCLSYIHNSFVVLWNPSIGKFKELPPFVNIPLTGIHQVVKYGFGYDHVSRNYKVVVLYHFGRVVDTIKVKVYTLSTNSWRNIQTLPFPSTFSEDQNTIYVSGTINWLVYANWPHSFFIVSFDLGKDSSQRICPPGGFDPLHVLVTNLCVLKDCLCIVSHYDVWIMKEYGVKESWTKLFTVSNSPAQFVPYSCLTNVLYIFEDDKVLLEEKWEKKLIIYDFKNDTFEVTAMFETLPEICCTESLISPCS